jgi:predicted DNA binding protein
MNQTALKEISIEVKNTNPFKELATKFACQINVVDCKETAFDTTSLLLKVTGARSLDLLKELKEINKVKEVHFSGPQTKSGKGSFLVLVKMGPLFYCSAAHDSNAFCLSCPYSSTEYSNEKIPWKMLVTDLKSMRSLMDSLERNGRASDLSDVSIAFYDDILTPRQREILLKASELGYFCFPRKKGLTELADEMSISAATLSEILRSAESKIMRRYVDSMKSKSE